jgi:hypothetical protein
MSASTLSRNVSSGAAGIYNFFGTVGLTSVTLRDNTTTFDGTGIHNVTGSVTITTSTISGNNGRNGGWIKTKAAAT